MHDVTLTNLHLPTQVCMYFLPTLLCMYGKKIVIAKVSQAEDDRCQVSDCRTQQNCGVKVLLPDFFPSRAGTCDDGQTSLHLGGQAI